jgi:hypothetical protein
MSRTFWPFPGEDTHFALNEAMRQPRIGGET